MDDRMGPWYGLVPQGGRGGAVVVRGDGNDSWFWDMLHIAAVIAVIILAVVAVVALLRWISEEAVVAETPVGPLPAAAAPVASSGDDDAVQALRLRYARGEMGHDEYARTFAGLAGRPTSPNTETTLPEGTT